MKNRLPSIAQYPTWTDVGGLMSYGADRNSESPPKFAGLPATWVRLRDSQFPSWADEAFKELEREGLAGYFARMDTA